MTKKEIYSKVVEVQQKMLNEFGYYYPITIRNVSKYLTRTTKEELENELNILEHLYEIKCLDKKRREYFATDEGKAELDRINKRLEELRSAKDELMNITTAELDKLIKNNYCDWGVTLYPHLVNVSMLDEDGKPIPGHNFDISWYDDNDVVLRFSCGGLSSFEIENDEYRCDLIEVIHDFLHSRKFKTGVYDQFKAHICQFAILNKAFKKEIDDLEEMKTNPFVKK